MDLGTDHDRPAVWKRLRSDDPDLPRSLKRLSALLLAMSLFLPVFAETANAAPEDYTDGWGVLIIGPLGVIMGQFGWFGNVGLLIGLVTKGRWPSAITGVCFASALDFTQVTGDSGFIPVTNYGTGYYIWLSAMLVATVPIILPTRRGGRGGGPADPAEPAPGRAGP